MPESEKELACKRARLGAAAGGPLLHLLEQFGELRARHLFAEGLDLDFAARRGPAAAGGADLGLRHELCGNAEPDAGRHGVLDDAPAVIFLAGAHRAAERLPLLRCEDAGLVELVALLERLHRRDRAVAEFRIEAARRDRRTRPGRTGSRAARRPAWRHRPPSARRWRRGGAQRRGFVLRSLGRRLFCRLGLRLALAAAGWPALAAALRRAGCRPAPTPALPAQRRSQRPKSQRSHAAKRM